MKKLLFMLCALISLTSCVKNDPSANFDPESSDNEKVIEHYEFGQGFSNPNITEFIYDGEPLLLPYQFSNMADSFDTGIVVFINGIAQKYTTDISNEELYVHTFHIPEKENVTMNLYIQPNTGNKGDYLNIHIGSIFKVNEIVTSMASYGHQHNLSQIIGFPVSFRQATANKPVFNFLSAESEKVITAEERKIYEKANEDTQTTSNILDTDAVIEIFQEEQKITDTIDLDKEITVRFAGKEAQYKGYIFLDNQINEDLPVLDIQIKKDTFSEFTFKINEKEYKNFYIILAPTDINEYLYQSEKFIIGD